VGNYVGRNVTVDIKLQDRALSMQTGATTKAFRFISPTEAFVESADADTVTYVYFAAGRLEPAHFECSIGEQSLDYNEGGQDIAGPDKPSWAQRLGEYRIYQWGRAAQRVTIHRCNVEEHSTKARYRSVTKNVGL
jgi:hypothetical protein